MEKERSKKKRKITKINLQSLSDGAFDGCLGRGAGAAVLRDRHGKVDGMDGT